MNKNLVVFRNIINSIRIVHKIRGFNLDIGTAYGSLISSYWIKMAFYRRFC
jgi:hypothetical protein